MSCTSLVSCGNGGKKIRFLMNILKINAYILFDIFPCPLLFTLSIGKIIQDVIFHLSFFFRSRESQAGELAEAPSQILLQSARNITIEVLCAEKSKWAHTHTQKHPSAAGQTATGPLQPHSQWMCIVLPPTGTCCSNLLLCCTKAATKCNN